MLAEYRRSLRVFFSESWLIWVFVAMTVFRFLAGAFVPLGNDEAYYWDWGRQVHLSYYDHPVFVSILSWLAQFVGGAWGQLQARLFIPVVHLVVSLNLIVVAARLSSYRLDKFQKVILVVAGQLAPIINLGGFMLMPDAGLLLWMSSFLVLGSYLFLYPNLCRPYFHSLCLGLLGGFAFISKYHGIVMSCTGYLTLVFLCARLRNIKAMSCFVFGFLLASAPVIVWNLQNEFISFRFQLDHGLGSPQFHLSWGLRTFLAQFILCTPLVVLGLMRACYRSWRNDLAVFIIGTSLPLALIIFGASFFKEALPHWLLPSIWLMIPLLTLLPRAGRWWIKGHIVYCLVLVSLLVSGTAIPSVRNWIIQTMDERPQGLGEMTLWPYLSLDLKEMNFLDHSHFAGDEVPEGCPKEPLIASFRWFWGAQLAYRLDGQPRVFVLDAHKPSYYDFRDDLSHFIGCPIVLVGDKKHMNKQWLSRFVDINRQELIVPTMHKDRQTVVVWGAVAGGLNRIPK